MDKKERKKREREKGGIDPWRKGPRQCGAVIFSSSGNVTGISLVIKSHRAVWLELMVKWSICPEGKKSSAVKWPRHSICTWWHVAACEFRDTLYRSCFIISSPLRFLVIYKKPRAPLILHILQFAVNCARGIIYIGAILCRGWCLSTVISLFCYRVDWSPLETVIEFTMYQNNP